MINIKYTENGNVEFMCASAMCALGSMTQTTCNLILKISKDKAKRTGAGISKTVNNSFKKFNISQEMTTRIPIKTMFSLLCKISSVIISDDTFM